MSIKDNQKVDWNYVTSVDHIVSKPWQPELSSPQDLIDMISGLLYKIYVDTGSHPAYEDKVLQDIETGSKYTKSVITQTETSTPNMINYLRSMTNFSGDQKTKFDGNLAKQSLFERKPVFLFGSGHIVDKDGNILRLTTSRVFSGNGDGKNNPDNVGNKDNGPIPPGKYYVIKRQSGGIRSRIEDWTYKLWNDNDKTQWLAFIAIDDALDDQKEINGVFRSSFRMHYGTRSLGCITFLDKEVFEKAREFILETESRTVKGADGTEYIYYGILEVKKE